VNPSIWVLWILPFLAAAGDGSTNGTLEAFLDDFSERRAAVENVQAIFIQEEISPDDAVRSEGTLVFVQPRRILFRYADPEIAYLVDGLRVYEYDAEFEQVQAFDLENDPEADALFLGFGGNPDRLREAYDLSLVPALPESCGVQVLTLRPKLDMDDDDGMASLFEEARITLGGDDLLPCRIEIINSAESRIEITIVEYRVNKPIESGSDRLELPEGTRIIEDDALTETVGSEGAVLPRSMTEAVNTP
jgi:outer membrane lipoprotein-sorting protein